VKDEAQGTGCWALGQSGITSSTIRRIAELQNRRINAEKVEGVEIVCLKKHRSSKED
jgi:hypothetical protein